MTAGEISNTATVSGSGTTTGPILSEPSTVEVAAVVTPPPPPPTAPGTTTPTPGELPATGGGNLQRDIGLAASLVLLGLLAVTVVRRRRRLA